MSDSPTAESITAGWLRRHRPDLADPFRAAVPGARAAVLTRLWGAIAREPLPGLLGRDNGGGTVTVRFTRHRVDGSAAAADPSSPETVTSLGGHRDPAMLAADLWPDAPWFAAELADSVANLALARANHTPAPDDSLAAAEQSVVDGHPLHPCCRSRAPLSPDQVLAYAPEHRPVVRLPVVAVPPERWLGTGAARAPELIMHPWQWQQVRDTFPWLTDTGRRHVGRPLMSVRTVATAHAHVKTAMTARLTSATRIVSPAAVRNGPVLSVLLGTLTARTPGFGVLRERAAGAVLVDGEPSRHLSMVVRDRPRLRPGERAVPLAGLPDVPTDDPVGLVGDLARLLLPPLFTLLDLGVALEAHGQNVVVVLRAGRPYRLLYRDLGGLRVSPAALARAGIAAPPLHGDIPCDDPQALSTKLLAAVTTGLGGLVCALAGRYGVDPPRLWAAVAAVAPRLRELPTLPVKALTLMRLRDTVDDMWTTVANPVADAP